MLSRGPGVLFLANKVLCSALCPWCTSVTMLEGREHALCLVTAISKFEGLLKSLTIKLLNFVLVLIDVPGASSYWTSSVHHEDTDVLYF